MTTGAFKYIDPASISDSSSTDKPWAKVDGPGRSFTLADHLRNVTDMRGNESSFSTDTSGFSVHTSVPAEEKLFTDDARVRSSYYADVKALLRQKLPGVKRVEIFDHTIRRREKSSPRQPVQQVHVDQTPRAAEARVRRHLPAAEAEELLRGRYQIINVWRPIGHVASDFPLALVDWRTTEPGDFVAVDLLYPARAAEETDGDDRGKEALPVAERLLSTEGYEVRGETYAVRPSGGHGFYYMKDMAPDEAMFIKCYDSRSRTSTGEGHVAHCTPHTAFVDPDTPEGAEGRQSIEVRCLVFY